MRRPQESADEDEKSSFSYRLEFAAANCPGCGQAAEPGACPNCGVEVPIVDEISELHQARISALEPLVEKLDELIRASVHFRPGGNATVS